MSFWKGPKIVHKAKIYPQGWSGITWAWTERDLNPTGHLRDELESRLNPPYLISVTDLTNADLTHDVL